MNATGERGFLAAWIEKHSGWLAALVVLAGFGLKYHCAAACYLNPDETQHFNAARQVGWGETWRSASELAHPPLYILVLHLTMLLGRTEMILRMPSLIFGTLALVVAFAWMRQLLGTVGAIVGIWFLSFSPAVISSASEVRQYGIFLFMACGALYAVEQAFTRKSARWVVAEGMCLAGALLTHYTAVFPVISLAVYVFVRLRVGDIPRHIATAFYICQGLSLVLLAGLFCWRIHHLMNHPITEYLEPMYFDRDKENLLGFVRRELHSTFEYIVGMRRLADVTALILAGGIFALITHREPRMRLTGLLVLLPLAGGMLAASVRVLPFDGTRHETYLFPFIALGLGAAATWLQRRIPDAIFWTAAASLGLFFLARTAPPDNNPKLMPKQDMAAAIQYMRSYIAPGSLIFADDETFYELGYYLDRNNTNLNLIFTKKAAISLYNVMEPGGMDWEMTWNQTLPKIMTAAKKTGVDPGQNTWMASVAWLNQPLAQRIPADAKAEVHSFGLITLVKLPPMASSGVRPG